MGKTAAMMVVWNAELAQSYIAQARSSGRPRPRRSSRWFILGTPHALRVHGGHGFDTKTRRARRRTKDRSRRAKRGRQREQDAKHALYSFVLCVRLVPCHSPAVPAGDAIGLLVDPHRQPSCVFVAPCLRVELRGLRNLRPLKTSAAPPIPETANRRPRSACPRAPGCPRARARRARPGPSTCRSGDGGRERPPTAARAPLRARPRAGPPAARASAAARCRRRSYRARRAAASACRAGLRGPPTASVPAFTSSQTSCARRCTS